MQVRDAMSIDQKHRPTVYRVTPVTSNLSMGLRWVTTILGGIAYLFILSWKLTLVMLAVSASPVSG